MKLIWLALLVGTVCVGQQPSEFDVSSCRQVCDSKGLCVNECKTKEPAPLKCQKYEHVERPVSKCPDDQPVGCMIFPEPPRCAPDLHVVTEKEWVETQERLKAMDKYITESICRGFNYKATITTDGGKTLIDCATVKPKPCTNLGNGLCYVQ